MGISIPQHVVLYIVGLYFMLLSNAYVEGHARGMAGRVADIPGGSIGVYDALVQEFNARFGVVLILSLLLLLRLNLLLNLFLNLLLNLRLNLLLNLCLNLLSN